MNEDVAYYEKRIWFLGGLLTRWQGQILIHLVESEDLVELTCAFGWSAISKRGLNAKLNRAIRHEMKLRSSYDDPLETTVVPAGPLRMWDEIEEHRGSDR